MMLCGLVYAQDLEDEFLKISVKDIDTTEEDYSEEEEALDEILSAYDISDKRINSQDMGKQELVAAKREQLGIILRRAYYQKLTTPKWVSVISSDSWRGSFLKWRYYAQLRNYIANIDNDLTYFNENKPLLAMVPSKPSTLDLSEVLVDKVEEDDTTDTADEIQDTQEIEQEIEEEVIAQIDIPEILKADVISEPIDDEEEQAEEEQEAEAVAEALDIQSLSSKEEDWEIQGAEELEEETPVIATKVEEEEITEEALSFSLGQLTLPDDIVSERAIYEEALLAARLDSITIAKEDATALALLDEALAARDVKEKNIPSSVKEKRPTPSKKKEERKKEETTRSVAQVQKSTAETSKRAVTSAPARQETIVANTTTNTYTPNVSTNRTITAASVAPSTAPRSISAGRLAQTAGFVKRKGKMSWPVMTGTVTDQYGIRPNAAARGLKPRNNGVDMSCPTSTSVLSVHSGTVMMVAKQAPYDHIVTVKHGDYTSAYYYINRPSVNVGDVVAMGQRLGRLIGGEGEAQFHFELWEGQNKVNPEIWLAPK